MPQDVNKHLSPSFVPWVQGCLRRGFASSEKRSRPIDKIPRNWRDVHNDAFNPQMIRIGPLHGSKDARDDRQWFMEEHKARFLNRLLEGDLNRLLEGEMKERRSDGDMSRTTEEERLSVDCERGQDDDDGRVAKALCLDDLAEAMRTLEHQTKACYSKDISTIHDTLFVMMMVVDGCFVVELLRLCYDPLQTKAPEDDPILANPHILTLLRHDLLLLENQLPFFVLEKLYEVINKKKNPHHQQAVPLEELAVTFFNPLLPQQNVISKLDAKERKAHLLDVFRSTFLKSAREKDHRGKNRLKSRSNLDGSMRGLYFASELNEAGVKFKKSKGHDLLDIEFGSRTLWVPPLSLDDNTISLLLNFVAYELSVNHCESFFTNYLMFWDSLVNSPRDIQILRKHRIINNMGSEKAVAELLMRCREVISYHDPGYLYDEIDKVNDCCQQYYESKYHVWWQSLIRERFSSPWTCLSLFAAIILLLLTLLQTFYTMSAYYRPH